MDSKQKALELGQKPVGKLLWQYALPAIVATAAASIYNIIDRAFIGQVVGADAIAGLSNNVASLTEENRSKAEKVQQQEKELNSAWFVFGTKSELKEQKILSKGDVLKSSDFNKDYFTKIDIRYDKDLKFYSKSAELLSTHPAGSYQLVKDKQGQYELHITDPQKFWSVSKYLVVQVK